MDKDEELVILRVKLGEARDKVDSLEHVNDVALAKVNALMKRNDELMETVLKYVNHLENQAGSY